MTSDKTSRESAARSLASSFERYLQDQGKGRDGSGGNYRRNVARELDRFYEWTTGKRGPEEWTGVVPADVDREPTFEDLNERAFRHYARHLVGDRGLKQNTAQTYYAYISSWCGWCVNEGYLEIHYAQRSSAKEPLPDDDGRKPGDQQAWSPEQRRKLTHYVDDSTRDAIEAKAEVPADGDPIKKQQARYTALKAARDRVLVYLIAYTAVRAGEILRDPNDPRRRGVRWEHLNLEDGSMEVYRKKQSWDSASLPDPVMTPLKTYKKLLDPPSGEWPVFPTFAHQSLATLLTDELGDRGLESDAIAQKRDAYARDLFVALDEDIVPDSLTTEGARSVLKRLTDSADIDVSGKHDYLAPHGGRRGMGEVLVREFGYTVAARYLDNSEEMIRERYSHIEAGELGDKVSNVIDR